MANLKISRVKLHPVQEKEGLFAFADFVVNGVFAVNGVGVYKRQEREGIRLVYPTRNLPNGRKIDLFHPIEKGIGEMIERIIWKEVKNQLFSASEAIGGS